MVMVVVMPTIMIAMIALHLITMIMVVIHV